MRSIASVLHSRAAVVLSRLVLSAIFIYAGIGKIGRPSEFADAVLAFRILPVETVNVFAIILPWVELLCGLSILFGVGAASAGLLLAIMNVAFIAAAVTAIVRGLHITCHCFAFAYADDKVGWSLVARDLLLLILCLPVILGPRGERKQQ